MKHCNKIWENGIKKIKLLKEYEEAYSKVDENADEKDIDEVFEKAEEIFKITKELEKRSWDGDEKASKEINEWNELIIKMNIHFENINFQ